MWGKYLTIQMIGYIEGTVLRGAFSLNSSPNSFSTGRFAVHCIPRSEYRKKTTTWFSTSAAASGQEILQHMLVCSSLLFLLDFFCFFPLENGPYSNQFTYLTEILLIFWLNLKFKLICKISCCWIICMCIFPDQILQRFKTQVSLNSERLHRFR